MKEIDKDIRSANTLPGDFYSKESIFSKSVESIFSRTWQFICDTSVLEKQNDVYPFTLLKGVTDEPLFLINYDNKISCYSNVCTHRGNILIHNACNIKNNIICNYHGKQFNTKGIFQYMPKTEGMLNFPCEEDNLTEVSVFEWKQFVFISLDPVFKFNDLIKEVEDRVGWMPIKDFKYSEELSKSYLVDANWALYCDNYLEGFHIPFIHNDLNNVLDFGNYKTEIYKYANLQIGIGKEDDVCFDLPKESKDFGKRIAAYYFWLFPNFMLNFYPWGLSVNIITPLSVKKTKVEFKCYIWDAKKLDQGAGADIDKVELEDEEVIQNVQKGVGSRFYKHGRFSPTMEKGVHHFHTLISDFLKK